MNIEWYSIQCSGSIDNEYLLQSTGEVLLPTFLNSCLYRLALAHISFQPLSKTQESPLLCWLDFNMSMNTAITLAPNIYIRGLPPRASDSYTFEAPKAECISTAFFFTYLPTRVY